MPNFIKHNTFMSLSLVHADLAIKDKLSDTFVCVFAASYPISGARRNILFLNRNSPLG